MIVRRPWLRARVARSAFVVCAAGLGHRLATNACPLSPPDSALTLATLLICASVLTAIVAVEEPPSLARELVGGCAVGAGAWGLASWGGLGTLTLLQLGGLTAAVAVLSVAGSAMTGLVAGMLRGPSSQSASCARAIVFAALVTLGAAPVWLGPLAEQYGNSRPIVDAIVAASPLTYVATMLHYDYLRRQWFYAHCPIGSLRYAYPSVFVQTLAYVMVAVLCSTVAQRLARRALRQTDGHTNVDVAAGSVTEVLAIRLAADPAVAERGGSRQWNE